MQLLARLSPSELELIRINMELELSDRANVGDFVRLLLRYVARHCEIEDDDQTDAAVADPHHAETRPVGVLCPLSLLRAVCCVLLLVGIHVWVSSTVIMACRRFCRRLKLAMVLEEAFHQIDIDNHGVVSFQSLLNYIVTVSCVSQLALATARTEHG